jgi:hypothetical protein
MSKYPTKYFVDFETGKTDMGHCANKCSGSLTDGWK